MNPNDDMCYATIHAWLEACAGHPNCRSPEAVLLPKRIIEIPGDASKPLRLLGNHKVRDCYVILSHCWGKAGIAKLTTSLLNQYEKEIPLQALPRTFKDAIAITRRLGYRYIWIDALCIIQDDAEDWADEAPKMGQYYGQSALMICATIAHNSSKGILRNRDVVHSPALGKGGKHRLRRAFQDYIEDDIDKSVLQSRAWTAQERILAPRILHYAERRIIWECAGGIWCENRSSIDAKALYLQRNVYNFDKTIFQTSIAKSWDLEQRNTPKDSLSPYIAEASIHTPLFADISQRNYAWQQCIHNYGTRNLTYPSDKLPAVSGVAKVLNHDGALGQYLAGLWSQFLGIGLARYRFTVHIYHKKYRAPSWSWASADGETDPPGRSEDFSLNDSPWRSKLPILLENRIILEDSRNPYGAVREGSSIVVEASCITKAELLRLQKLHKTLAGADLSLDKDTERCCSCCESVDEDRIYGSKSDPEKSNDGTDFDFCMFLVEVSWGPDGGMVDLMLMEWVNQEDRVAKRVGYMRTWLFKKRDQEEEVRSVGEDNDDNDQDVDSRNSTKEDSEACEGSSEKANEEVEDKRSEKRTEEGDVRENEKIREEGQEQDHGSDNAKNEQVRRENAGTIKEEDNEENEGENGGENEGDNKGDNEEEIEAKNEKKIEQPHAQEIKESQDPTPHKHDLQDGIKLNPDSQSEEDPPNIEPGTSTSASASDSDSDPDYIDPHTARQTALASDQTRHKATWARKRAWFNEESPSVVRESLLRAGWTRERLVLI